MPWRTYIDKEFDTFETTNMSEENLQLQIASGWREASLLEFQLAQLCRPYGTEKVKETLNKITSPEYFDNSVGICHDCREVRPLRDYDADAGDPPQAVHYELCEDCYQERVD